MRLREKGGCGRGTGGGCAFPCYGHTRGHSRPTAVLRTQCDRGIVTLSRGAFVTVGGGGRDCRRSSFDCGLLGVTQPAWHHPSRGVNFMWVCCGAMFVGASTRAGGRRLRSVHFLDNRDVPCAHFTMRAARGFTRTTLSLAPHRLHPGTLHIHGPRYISLRGILGDYAHRVRAATASCTCSHSH
jgi:hypothetical protein